MTTRDPSNRRTDRRGTVRVRIRPGPDRPWSTPCSLFSSPLVSDRSHARESGRDARDGVRTLTQAAVSGDDSSIDVR
ncbi:hypothetical protein [Halomontanus rarus]|uniref:hypothetical protein n=1 Tax=Halomontanus rarus TaxID=3034020 RepID=UPI001A997EE0